jgi:hypothetical protein
MENTAVKYDAEKYPNFKEYLWYKQHEAELLERFPSRYVVIKDEKVIADFESRSLAGTLRLPRVVNRQLVTVRE